LNTALEEVGKYAALLQLLPTATLLVDEVGYLAYANDFCAEIWQHPTDQLVGQNWMGLDTDLTLLRWKKLWRESQQQKRLRYTTHVLTQQDLLRPVSVQLLPLSQKAALLLVETTLPQTITDAQLQLLSRTRGYWHYDHFTQTCFFSASCLRLLGLDQAEDRQLPLSELAGLLGPLLGEQRYAELLEQVQQAVRANVPFEGEVIAAAGPIRLRVQNQHNALHVAFVAGVVEPIALDAGTRSPADFFSRFSLDHTDELIFWVDAAGKFIYTNQAFCRRVGYTATELAGTSANDFVVGRTEAQRQADWEELCKQKSAEGEHEMRTRDGRNFPVVFRTYYLQAEAQELACVFVHDAGDLKRQERLLELTKFSTDKSPDLIFWTRPNGSFVYVNERVAKALQYARSDFGAMQIKTIAPYFDAAARKAFWERLRQEKQFSGEYALTRRDGTEFPISANVNYLQFEGEEIACSFGRDIGAEKLQERRRRLSEFTVDHSNELILWVRPDGHIHFANQTFLERTGYGVEEVEEAPITRFFPTYTEEGRQRLWEQLREQQQFGLEASLGLKSGEVIPIYANFNYLVYEGQEFDCAYIRDWTKKHERDTQLELTQAALEEGREAVLWLNEDLRVRDLNRASLQLLGGAATQWQGLTLDKVLPGLDFTALAGKDPVEHHLPTPAGHTVFLEWSRTQVDLHGTTYYTLVGRNVTERVLRRKELEKAYQRIEEMTSHLQNENLVLREERDLHYDINNIVTVSPAYQRVLQQVGQVADTDTTVLITGETGTGKELLARAVHNLSDRQDYPLIKVNCAALPENLIESELFGHEKGAFTGAQERKKGRFELANRGTIFLDEIGELPLSLQVKLLRVLQEGEFERVGGTQSIRVDVRLIAATNRDLVQMVKDGHFRADLFYRINVFPIRNMPLRERPEDIEVLTEHFTQRFAREQGKKISRISSADLKNLQSYSFPGNVRELENIVERAVVLCQTETLRIPFEKQNVVELEQQRFLTFGEMQRQYIIDALKKTSGRISGPAGAGRLLGLNDRTLMSKMRKFKIEKREYIL
jgi:PAS domain S-box-containing protein